MDDPSLETLLEKYRIHVDSLREALACTELYVDYPYRDGFAVVHEMHHNAGLAVMALTDWGAMRLRQGRVKEALEFLLIAIGTAQDLYRGVPAPSTWDGRALDLLREIVSRGLLTDEDRRSARETVNRLWAGRSAFLQFVRLSLLFYKGELLKIGRGEKSELEREEVPARFFYCWRIAAADSLREYDRYEEELDRIEKLPSSERWTALIRSIESHPSTNPFVVRAPVSHFQEFWEARLAADEKLRLVREELK